MKSVLFDVNVVLDVLGSREPFAEDSARALGLAEVGLVTGYVAAHTVTTLHFLLERRLGMRRARRVLGELLQVVAVLPVDEDVIRQGLASNWADFEDAVQAGCAERAGCDYLVTRDKAGFKQAAVRVVAPAELLGLVA